MARGDLHNPRIIYLKGAVFLVIALASSALLLLENFSVRFAVLLGISVWAFCRSYYFAFYVIEHYVDPGFHFAGLLDFARYLVGRPRH